MNKNSVKVIAFDLDGTLLNSQKEISVKSINTIQNLYDKGHEIIIATARPLRTIHKYVSDIKVPVSLVLQNGAAYSINCNDFIVNYIEEEYFINLIKYLCTTDSMCAISIMENDEWFTISDFDYNSFYHVDIGPTKILKENMLKKKCTKILINNCTVGNKVKELFQDKVNILETDNQTLVQIMSKKSSKEFALKKILEGKEVNKENLICFGDDHNDIGMFKYSAYSIAMGNSVKQLKDIANYITETNDNEGIYKFFTSEKWREIEKT